MSPVIWRAARSQFAILFGERCLEGTYQTERLLTVAPAHTKKMTRSDRGQRRSGQDELQHIAYQEATNSRPPFGVVEVSTPAALSGGHFFDQNSSYSGYCFCAKRIRRYLSRRA